MLLPVVVLDVIAIHSVAPVKRHFDALGSAHIMRVSSLLFSSKRHMRLCHISFHSEHCMRFSLLSHSIHHENLTTKSGRLNRVGSKSNGIQNGIRDNYK